MIISASVRTDIPALYSKWFIERLKAGYVLVRNPYNNKLISEIDLSTKVVDCIVFCTKDPQNIIKYIDQMDQLGYNYYFMVTLTPYNQTIEPRLRNKNEIIFSFIELSKKIGKDKITWRYDPILINDIYTIDKHIDLFEKMCYKLSPYTNIVIISFIDIYNNIKDKFQPLTISQVETIALAFGNIGKKYGLNIQTCAEKYDLTKFGITNSPCVNQTIIEHIIKAPIEIKSNPNRLHCNCLTMVDIGEYESCNHGCTYCYACKNEGRVKANMLSHDINGELLFGKINEDDKIVKRKVVSNKVTQLKFDL